MKPFNDCKNWSAVVKGDTTHSTGHIGCFFQTEKIIGIRIIKPSEVHGNFSIKWEKWLKVC